MSDIEVIGMIGVNREKDSSRGVTVSLFGGGINPADEIPAGVDPDYIAEFSQAHEESGFDKVLIGYSSATADSFAVAGYAANQTERAGLPHRAPGRVHGPHPGRPPRRHSGPAQRRTHCAARYFRRQRRGAAARWRLARSRLPLPSHRRVDGNRAPYLGPSTPPSTMRASSITLSRPHSQVRTRQRPHVPLYFGGASEAAMEVGARHC